MGQQQQKMEIFNNENNAHNTNTSNSATLSDSKLSINTQPSAANSYFNSLSTKS